MGKIKIGLLFVFFSFSIHSQEIDTYQTFYNHWDTEGFLKQFSRGMDNDGIVTQKGIHHPLILCFYGIINYHEFKDSGDSMYYKRVIDQYQYFTCADEVDYLDRGKSVGLGYKYSYKDLKAPWYSGMTQGTAVSYLLRYFELTRDSSALELSKKVVHLMLKNEKAGGTMGRTKEGLPWIEEYPQSKSSKSVLNGFVNGLIGLKEYCDYFPEDFRAKDVHDSCYLSLLSSVSLYDKPNWTSYNRNGGGVSRGYLRYQLSEFDHLFSIYKDSTFRIQMMIWSKFANGKNDKELKFYRNPDFSYGIKLIKDDLIYSYTDYQNFDCGLRNIIEMVNDSGIRKKRIKKVTFCFHISRNYSKLIFSKSPDSNFLIKGFRNGKEVELVISLDENEIQIQSEEKFDSLQLKFKRKQAKTVDLISVLEYDYKEYNMPLFGIIEMPEQKIMKKDANYTIEYTGEYLTGAKLFYRYDPKSTSALNRVYSTSQSIDLKSKIFIPSSDGKYQFFIGYEITTPSSQLTSFEIKLIE
mgnify:CR=1 FL=1|tara:strand:- start:1342 stop:2907 length:1566 start_codon:yes stop_codon:yes gene_type:complete